VEREAAQVNEGEGACGMTFQMVKERLSLIEKLRAASGALLGTEKRNGTVYVVCACGGSWDPWAGPAEEHGSDCLQVMIRDRAFALERDLEAQFEKRGES
jgi:hypothetical protein